MLGMVMNPALLILIIIFIVAIWFLLSFLYKPIGKFIFRIGKDAIDEIMDDEKEKE